MSNVVSISGSEVVSPYEPVQSVVEAAEKILEMARSGEIHSLVAFMKHGDEAVTCQRSGTLSYRLMGLITVVQADLARQMADE